MPSTPADPNPQTVPSRSRASAIRAIGGRAAIVSLARLLNQGLILISPMILVRLLSVEDFGRYREFIVYATVLITIAGFGINSSLLRFVPSDPRSSWRYVDQSVWLTLASSLLVTGAAFVLHELGGGRMLGEFGPQVALYVLLFVNLDFWEFLWLAEKRTYAVFAYTTARLVARITVVTIAAALTRDVGAIVSALIVLESLRLALCAIGWRWRARKHALRGEYRWKEQLEFCLPYGAALAMVTVNKSLGALFVAKMLGPVALAHYAIGVYVQPVITVLRNSLSDVLLPEMVSNGDRTTADRLELWRRSTVAAAIALIGVGVVLARFAEPLIETFFSEKYLPAVPIFQLYLLTFLRESIDFAVPLRAADRTAAILRSNVLALLVNIGLMGLLVPKWGVLGAVAAFLVSRAIEGFYLAGQTMRAYAIDLSGLARWGDLFKVLLAAALAATVIATSFWTDTLGIFGAALGGSLYLCVFILLLGVMRVQEANALLRLLRLVRPSAARRSN
jgi:Membrane protein involved in the export of O-antigen and teichoic acid